MKLFLLMCVLSLGTMGYSQDNWRLFRSSEKTAKDTVADEPTDTIRSLEFDKDGKVAIFKDVRINKVTELTRGQLNITKPGFRVQLKLGQTKEEVNSLRAAFLRIYSDHKAHIEYRQPNFILKVGDFYTRQQALEFKYKVIEQFPDAIVIKDNIELPKLPEAATE